MIVWMMMDKAEFSRLYERYKGLVYSICFNVLHDENDALEASNDTFVKIDRFYNTLRDKSKEKNWIAHIATNCALTYRTKIYKIKEAEVEELPEIVRSEESKNPETIVISKEMRDELFRAIKQMPPAYSELFVLAYYYEFTTGEIAAMLDLNIATVQKRLQRGRMKLKEILYNGRWAK